MKERLSDPSKERTSPLDISERSASLASVNSGENSPIGGMMDASRSRFEARMSTQDIWTIVFLNG